MTLREVLKGWLEGDSSVWPNSLTSEEVMREDSISPLLPWVIGVSVAAPSLHPSKHREYNESLLNRRIALANQLSDLGASASAGCPNALGVLFKEQSLAPGSISFRCFKSCAEGLIEMGVPLQAKVKDKAFSQMDPWFLLTELFEIEDWWDSEVEFWVNSLRECGSLVLPYPSSFPNALSLTYKSIKNLSNSLPSVDFILNGFADDWVKHPKFKMKTAIDFLIDLSAWEVLFDLVLKNHNNPAWKAEFSKETTPLIWKFFKSIELDLEDDLVDEIFVIPMFIQQDSFFKLLYLMIQKEPQVMEFKAPNGLSIEKTLHQVFDQCLPGLNPENVIVVGKCRDLMEAIKTESFIHERIVSSASSSRIKGRF